MKKQWIILSVAGVLGAGAAGSLLVGSALASQVKGTVDNVAADRVVVAGKVVRIDGNTDVRGQLVAGSTVEIKTRKSDGALVAVRIQVKDAVNDEDNEGSENEQEGAANSATETETHEQAPATRQANRESEQENEQENEREGAETENEHGAVSPRVAQPTPPATNSTPVSFSTTVQPILTQNCVSCHSGQGVNLTTYSAVRNLVVPGNPASSTLYSVVAGGRMPPNGSLSQAQMQAISDWIYQGAQNN